MSHAIEICGLQKSYGNHIVLHDISCCILQGEIFGLLGVNGSGKTTALECIEGLRRYDKGDITVNGKVGIQLQLASLPAHIKPMEALQLAAKWNQTDKDDEMIGALGIEQLSKKQYTELSTGQKRRLHLHWLWSASLKFFFGRTNSRIRCAREKSHRIIIYEC